MGNHIRSIDWKPTFDNNNIKGQTKETALLKKDIEICTKSILFKKINKKGKYHLPLNKFIIY